LAATPEHLQQIVSEQLTTGAHQELIGSLDAAKQRANDSRGKTLLIEEPWDTLTHLLM
jgi:hypothetical protein